MRKTHIFILDSIDSFIFNLVDFLYSVTNTQSIYRNTVNPESIFQEMITAEENGDYPVLLLSPGPKSPKDIPNMNTLLHLCKGRFPIVGICLGHQAIVEYYGGVVDGADAIMHGKKSTASLEKHPVFKDLGDTLEVARYHSLVAKTLPESLQVIAQTDDAIMGVVDDANKVVGFQFHPESILSVQGEQLLRNTFAYLTQTPNG